MKLKILAIRLAESLEDSPIGEFAAKQDLSTMLPVDRVYLVCFVGEKGQISQSLLRSPYFLWLFVVIE